MSIKFSFRVLSVVVAAVVILPAAAFAQCPAVTHAQLQTALVAAVNQQNGGFGLQMWATIVDRTGVVCAVAKSGAAGEQWPGSRVISAQKANTANAFSLPGLALSTANLYSATQPGGSLFGLQESNPVNPVAAYAGPAENWGTDNDPMKTGRIGGINVFGGGLALYSAANTIVGGLGVSGDSSCADHNIAWRVRHALNLDVVPGGVAPDHTDNIVYDISSDFDPIFRVFMPARSVGGWGHSKCNAASAEIAGTLPTELPIGPAQ